MSYHNSGELQEGETTVHLGLLVLDEAHVGGGERGEGSQRRQDGFHISVWSQVPQDQS